MNLDPPRYECPVHHVDLTSLVLSRLREDADSDLAFGNRGVLRGLVARGRESGSASTRPFQVVVPCTGGDPPHMQVCEGSYLP